MNNPGTTKSTTGNTTQTNKYLQELLQKDFRKYMKSLSCPKTVRRHSRRAERHQKCGHEGEIKNRTILSSEDVI